MPGEAKERRSIIGYDEESRRTSEMGITAEIGAKGVEKVCELVGRVYLKIKLK